MSAIYDKIGKSYTLGRQTDPKLAKVLHGHFYGAKNILNIGAGTGSYEPFDMDVTAVEPSLTMIKQRAKNSAKVIQASAEALPFSDKFFSHAMTILSMHHWSNRAKAFSEIRRVTRESFVALTWCPPLQKEPYWLYRDYLTMVPQLNRSIFPTLKELRSHFTKVEEHILPIPHDCIDGFDGAYWKRPQAFLDPLVRENMSVFSKIENVEPILKRLADDLESEKWYDDNAEILDLEELDVGYRIFVAEM